MNTTEACNQGTCVISGQFLHWFCSNEWHDLYHNDYIFAIIYIILVLLRGPTSGLLGGKMCNLNTWGDSQKGWTAFTYCRELYPKAGVPSYFWCNFRMPGCCFYSSCLLVSLRSQTFFGCFGSREPVKYEELQVRMKWYNIVEEIEISRLDSVMLWHWIASEEE